MKIRDDLDKFYNNIVDTLKTDESKEGFSEYFYNSFLAGDNVIYQKSIAEIKNFDNEWIDTLESYLPSIDKILRNPKSTIRYDEEVVPIEKAKKINSKSIRHLAANTHLISNMDGDEVMPKKILSSQSEVEYGIYENRFIMTLIDRLNRFVGNRYEVIKSNIDCFQRNHLNMSSNYKINDSQINMGIDLSIKSEINDAEVKLRNEQLIERVTKIVKMLSGYKNSKFMGELKGQKPVKPPIMKTNIILKNPDFKNAYSLWLFLDRYNALIFDIDVQEKDLDLDSAYITSLGRLALLTYSIIQYNQEFRKAEYADKEAVKYERKATKIVKTHPSDIVKNPDQIAMEDNTINEYFLDQNSRMFKKSLVDLLGDDINYEKALKQTMNQTMDITNALYESVFEMNPDMIKDVEVDNLDLKKIDLDKNLDEAKKKAKIAQIVREAKEADYRKSIELEKQQLKNIADINSEMIKEKTAKKRISKEKQKRQRLSEEQKVNKQEKLQANDKLKAVQSSIKELTSMKSSLEKEQKKMTDRLVNQTEKALIAAEKEKAKIERQEELRKIKEERKQLIQEERERFKQQRELIRAKFKELKEKIVESEKANRQLELDKLKEKYNKIKEEEIKKIKARLN